MKKILLMLLVLSLSTGYTLAKPYDFLSAPNEGNRDLAPFTEHQFEKRETLDFKNRSEEYKEKREAKDTYLDYQEGKVDVPPTVKTQYNMQGPGSNNMQFVRDENGKIRIKRY
ncbi:hypothetical protein IJ541_06600 [bacterium]|nr:hypothetical protein [bacterium]